MSIIPPSEPPKGPRWYRPKKFSEPKDPPEWHKSATSTAQPSDKPPTWHRLFLIIGGCFFVIRLILDSYFANSAVLYVFVPFSIAVIIHTYIPFRETKSVHGRILNHIRNATIVMFATSAFLFEGFVCVLMFMPIYYVMVLIGYLFMIGEEKSGRNTRGPRAYTLPILVIALSLEGVIPATTIDRRSEASYSAIVAAGVPMLKANMAEPILFEQDRDWFISVFPSPVDVAAGSLNPGDIHTLKFTYKRWFFTNTHQGEMQLRIEEVGSHRIRTSIIKNTSYLANYLKIKGTEVRFSEIDDGHTQVSIHIHYDRLLDPSWYFGPMQQLAVEQSARYLLETVIARERPLS